MATVYKAHYKNSLGKDIFLRENFRGRFQAQRFVESCQDYSHGGVVMEYEKDNNTRSWHKGDDGKWY